MKGTFKEMMVWVLMAVVSFVLGTSSGYQCFKRSIRNQLKAESEVAHAHTWGKWGNAELMIGGWNNQYSQFRSCSQCGEIESRKVDIK